MSTETVKKPLRRLASPATTTTIAKVGQVDQRWYVVDAAGQTLGRLAAVIAMRLMGKDKPTYTNNVDTGDFVIVLNTAKIKASGRKMDQRTYEYYTYYPGGHKVKPMKELLAQHPTTLFEHAVRRMLPKNKLGVKMINKLKCFKDDKHPHASQNPIVWTPKL